jgi:hypothetical protein
MGDCKSGPSLLFFENNCGQSPPATNILIKKGEPVTYKKNLKKAEKEEEGA